MEASRSLRTHGPPLVERRATVRIYMLDADLRVSGSSAQKAELPPALRRTVLPLIHKCELDPQSSQAHVVSEGRIVRLVPMKGYAPGYVVCIERLSPHGRLLASLERFKFSPRELDVLLLMLEGRTAKETAQQLNLATSTVVDIITRLLTKTGARNKAALIAKVLGWEATPVKVG